MNKDPSPQDFPQNVKDDLKLARKAAEGDEVAREAVSLLVHPLIERRTKELCKEHCYGNHFEHHCVVDPKWGLNGEDDPLCELGHESYAWMLEYLTEQNRLQAYSGQNNATLMTYLSFIAKSKIFLYRWRNGRFKRRVYVPDYIIEISPLAKKLFFWMLDEYSVPERAQKAQVSIGEIEHISGQIIAELTERHKLDLLVPPKVTSISGQGDEGDHPESEQTDIDVRAIPFRPEVEEEWKMLEVGFKKLLPLEQIVLQAIWFQDMTAQEIRAKLVKARMTVKKKVLAEDLNDQQIYYFARKAKEKLIRLSRIDSRKPADKKINISNSSSFGVKAINKGDNKK